MKIAFCHHLSLGMVGGGERWVIETAREMKRRGHDVSVYALPFKLKGTSDVEQPKLLGSIPYHVSYFHHVQADVAYVTYHPFSQLSFRIDGKKIAGVHAQVYDSPYNYDVLPTVAKYAHKAFGKEELARFNAVHLVSPLTKCSHPHIYCIPNFVDSTIYKSMLKPEEFTVAFASRHVWQKGYDVWQSLKPQLERLATVKESGSIPASEMPRFLGSSHAVLNCSRVDTFGLSLIESVMCGSPVISSGIPIHKTLGVKMLYARAKKPQDYVELAGWLKSQWIKERDSYYKFAEQARLSALQYDKPKVMDKLERMFMEVANANT